MSEDTEAEAKGETKDPDVRWKGLSTLLSLAIAIFYLGLPTLAVVTSFELSAIPQAWWFMLTLGWVAVLAYTYGKDTIKAAREALKD